VLDFPVESRILTSPTTLTFFILHTVIHHAAIITISSSSDRPTLTQRDSVTRDVFGLVTGFTEHLQLVTTSNDYNPRLYTVCNLLRHAFSLLRMLRLHESSGNSFQRRTFPFLWVPEIFPCPNHSSSRLTRQKILNNYYYYYYSSKFFLLIKAQTGSGAHPASYPMSVGGSFPGGKEDGA
jgi:hypothetical protein